MASLFSRRSASGHGGPSDREITPQPIPDVAADVCTEDVHITEVVLTNNTAGAITVRMRDKQSTPAPLLPDDVSVPASTVVTFEFPRGALMVGGVSWVASSANSVWARVRAF